jgi:hypothetical protein
MSDKSKIVSLSEYLKFRDKKELQEERDAIQSEEFYQPAPMPKKSSIGGMRKATLLDKWQIAVQTVCPPGLTDEERTLLQLWLRHLYLPLRNFKDQN